MTDSMSLGYVTVLLHVFLLPFTFYIFKYYFCHFLCVFMFYGLMPEIKMDWIGLDYALCYCCYHRRYVHLFLYCILNSYSAIWLSSHKCEINSVSVSFLWLSLLLPSLGFVTQCMLCMLSVKSAAGVDSSADWWRSESAAARSHAEGVLSCAE